MVINNFTKSGSNVVPQVVKSISNTRYLSKRFTYTNVHRFSHRFTLKDIITKLLLGYPQIIKGKSANDLFQLNHYITKSKEEFLAKGQKFKKGWQTGKKTKELYIELNSKFNEVRNTNILRFLAELSKSIQQNK